MKCSIKNLLLGLLSAMLVAGCASHIPNEIRQAPQNNPIVAEVRTGPDRFVGSEVRWGGVIASVENLQTQTRLEIVARDLTNSGRPQNNDYSPGRFLADVAGFLDPAVYAVDREITVFGVVFGSKDKPIGQYPYRYPVISVKQHLLWEPLPKRDVYRYPSYWYDPWYDSWYDPWYRHHYRGYPYRYR
jgi:outer membrane lipoprotein